jgi:methanethiol S-methyltransferase
MLGATSKETPMHRRIAGFLFGVASYLVFLATFLYAVGFVGGFLVPTALDGAPRLPFGRALAIDLGLLALFAVQHSVMARPLFKRWLTRWVPPLLERSVYVLASSLCLIGMFLYWEPLGGEVWNLGSPWARAVAWALFAFGWGLVLVTTFLIHHFDLFGLRQSWLYLTGRPYGQLRFVEPGPYKLVRHPLYLGWFFAFWATPTMGGAHLVFALMTAAYILVAIQLEERDLVAEHGEAYESYRRRVPMLIPGASRRASARPIDSRHPA